MKLGLIQALEPETTGILDYEFPPMGLLYISSYLKKNIEIDIFLKEEINELIDISPDIIGISSNSLNFKRAIEIAKKIKKRLDIPVILGGPHISLLPYSLPSNMDIGVIGEGEETILELIKIYIKEKNFNRKNLSNIRGIIYKKGKDKIINSPRNLIEPLDLIPIPDRKIDPHTVFTPCIITSRGCPYNCKFCSLSTSWKKFRFFSTEYVQKELLTLAEDNTSYPHIRILDDVFALNIERLKNIRNFIIKNSLEKIFTFDCSIRAELFNEEICKILKDINVTRILLGAESGSEKILKYYKKGQNIKDIQRTIDLCRKYNIELTASFIIGAPVETNDDIKKTYKLIEKNKKKFWNVHVNILDPLPGTKIWEYARKKGLVTEKDREIKSINLSEYVTNKELNNWMKNFHELICNDIEKRFTIAREIIKNIYD